MTTAEQIVQPDLEAHVWETIGRPGLTTFAYAAERAWPGWLVAYSIQVDARATTKQAARDLAEDARLAMANLPAAPWAEGVVSYVQITEGPSWLPDPEDGKPRYTARYEVRAHPSPDGPAPPIGAERTARTVREERAR